jgi:hypothetical protein
MPQVRVFLGYKILYPNPYPRETRGKTHGFHKPVTFPTDDSPNVAEIVDSNGISSERMGVGGKGNEMESNAEDSASQSLRVEKLGLQETNRLYSRVSMRRRTYLGPHKHCPHKEITQSPTHRISGEKHLCMVIALWQANGWNIYSLMRVHSVFSSSKVTQ